MGNGNTPEVDRKERTAKPPPNPKLKRPAHGRRRTERIIANPGTKKPSASISDANPIVLRIL